MSKEKQGFGDSLGRMIERIFPEGINALFAVVTSLFFACAIAFHGYLSSERARIWMLPLAVAVLTPAFCYLQKLFTDKLPSFGPSGLRAQREKLSWRVFAAVAGVTFALMLINLLVNYPGGLDTDVLNQWNQAQTGVFNDWFPAIHSMMIRQVARVVNRYAFVIAVQMLCFSLLAGYMAATLRAWGLRWGWVAAFAVCLLSARVTWVMLLTPTKDVMFSMLALALAAHMVNIVFSEASWLQKWPNRIAFALALAMATLVRHNGIFFTVPVLVLLCIFYMKRSAKDCVITAAMAGIMIFCVRGPLYSLARVTRDPSQTYVETVGIPMTILCSVYRTEPDRLSPEATALMQAMATEEEWADEFIFGNYNSIKIIKSKVNPVVSTVPPGDLLRMTLQTVKAAPRISLRAVLSLTQFVWDPATNIQDVFWIHAADFRTAYLALLSPELPIPEEYGPYIDSIGRETLGINYSEAFAKTIGTVYSVLFMLASNKLLQSVGIAMFALMLAGGYSLRHRRGAYALLLIAPSIVYNLGTMLLLCGPDYRFFHFNVVITVPLVLACLAKVEPEAIQPSAPL